MSVDKIVGGVVIFILGTLFLTVIVMHSGPIEGTIMEKRMTVSVHGSRYTVDVDLWLFFDSTTEVTEEVYDAVYPGEVCTLSAKTGKMYTHVSCEER